MRAPLKWGVPKDKPPRPTAEQLEAAALKTVEDVIAPGLKVLFCGINPGLYTAHTGNHFAGPSNRFYPTLYASGFTPRLLRPEEKRLLLDYGLGITNVVARASRSADQLTIEEYRHGAVVLAGKIRRSRPCWLAVLGIGAYRTAFERPRADLGEQPDHRIAGTRVFVLPNTSGLNAHFRPADFARIYREFRELVQGTCAGGIGPASPKTPRSVEPGLEVD
jgi:TDG/mug DNA glycosylase family protein